MLAGGTLPVSTSMCAMVIKGLARCITLLYDSTHRADSARQGASCLRCSVITPRGPCASLVVVRGPMISACVAVLGRPSYIIFTQRHRRRRGRRRTWYGADACFTGTHVVFCANIAIIARCAISHPTTVSGSRCQVRATGLERGCPKCALVSREIRELIGATALLKWVVCIPLARGLPPLPLSSAGTTRI